MVSLSFRKSKCRICDSFIKSSDALGLRRFPPLARFVIVTDMFFKCFIGQLRSFKNHPRPRGPSERLDGHTVWFVGRQQLSPVSALTRVFLRSKWSCLVSSATTLAMLIIQLARRFVNPRIRLTRWVYWEYSNPRETYKIYCTSKTFQVTSLFVLKKKLFGQS